MALVFVILAILLIVYAFIYKEFPRININITHNYPNQQETDESVSAVGFSTPEEPTLTKKDEEEALRSDVASMVNAIMKGELDIE